jgi:hypothetical protein
LQAKRLSSGLSASLMIRKHLQDNPKFSKKEIYIQWLILRQAYPQEFKNLYSIPIVPIFRTPEV